MAEVQATLLAQKQSFHEHQLKENEPLYVGIVPVIYAVEGSCASTTRFFPISHTPYIHLDNLSKIVLVDSTHLCIDSMNNGTPLRVGTHHVVPGRFVRSKGKWTWKHRDLFGCWHEYYNGDASCGPLEILDGLVAGIPPDYLIDMLAEGYDPEVNSNDRLSLPEID